MKFYPRQGAPAKLAGLSESLSTASAPGGLSRGFLLFAAWGLFAMGAVFGVEVYCLLAQRGLLP